MAVLRIDIRVSTMSFNINSLRIPFLRMWVHTFTHDSLMQLMQFMLVMLFMLFMHASPIQRAFKAPS